MARKADAVPDFPAPTSTLTLTPTARLARAALRAHAAHEAHAAHAAARAHTSAAEPEPGKPTGTPTGTPAGAMTKTPAWLTPRILSLQTWLGELARAYFMTADDARVLISSEQARLIWQNEVERAVFIGEPEVADLALRAWRLVHEHDLKKPWQWPPAMLSPDAEHFQRWAQRYRRVCSAQGWVDEWAFAAELPDHIKAGRVDLPAVIRLIGFDRPLAPLPARVLEACAARGVRIEPAEVVAADATRAGLHSADRQRPMPLLAAATADTELMAAARWARSRLEQTPTARLAIVVPDLAGRVPAVTRMLRATFDPAGARLAGDTSPCWHISLGLPLSDWPLIADALQILGLEPRRMPQSELVHLLHSPFLQGADADDEAPARAHAALRLLSKAPWATTATEAQQRVAEAGALGFADLLSAWHTVRQQDPEQAWPSEWAARFQSALSAFGVGRGRPLDSPEYQALTRWHTVLEQFSALDTTTPNPIARGTALARLRDQARRVIFREENPGVPLEILGVEEAIGSRFDAVWITTLDAHRWPPAPERNPLVPLPVQATVPEASVAGAVAAAMLTLNALRATAPVVHGSFVRGDEQTPEPPSALLGPVDLHEADAEPAPLPARFDPDADDARGPAYRHDHVRGGTQLLTLQSACPFRAFAEVRLRDRAVGSPRP
ncbi:MAG: hypothetical protein ACKOBM_16615, partial [Gammaproteobacteria bacterium]